MNLSNLKPAEGSVKSQGKRVGRGQGSGKGGTATRGHKGAKSRSGYSRKVGFEGGLNSEALAIAVVLVSVLSKAKISSSADSKVSIASTNQALPFASSFSKYKTSPSLF